MTRRRWLGLAAVVAVAAAVAVPLATAEQTRSQRFFADKLIADSKTPERIKDLLRTGGGFVDGSIAFADLTGDEKDDAVVRLHTGGAPGVIGVYVFSTANGGDQLVPIFRSERLVRASTRLKRGILSYRYARYQPGDQLCCPSKLGEATLGWNAKRKKLIVTGRRTIDGPTK